MSASRQRSRVGRQNLPACAQQEACPRRSGLDEETLTVSALVIGRCDGRGGRTTRPGEQILVETLLGGESLLVGPVRAGWRPRGGGS